MSATNKNKYKRAREQETLLVRSLFIVGMALLVVLLCNALGVF